MHTCRRYPTRWSLLPPLLLGLGLYACLPAPARADCTADWKVVTSPDGSGENSVLGDLAAISSSDIWAVGNTGSGINPLSTLIEHWNGTSWNVVSSPNGSFPVNYLPSVSALSSTDVWAVGFTFNGSVSDGQSRTLILHWDGSTWSVVPSPNTIRPENRLYGVVAVAADDVWAVGTSFDFSVYRTLILHWDGSSWSIVPSPSPGSSFDILYGVDAVSASDIWAVGTQQEFLEQTLVLHWNGLGWAVVPSPQVGPYGNNMLKVFAISVNDVWAVGYHLTVIASSQPYQTSAFHYDGMSWSVVASPNVNQRNNYLFDVAGAGADDVWSVGFFDTGTAFRTMIQHWDGATWSIVGSPNPQPYTNELYGIEAVTADDVWAAGRASDGLFLVDTLVERYSCPETPGSTVSAGLTCLPSSGTLPFTTVFTATLTNYQAGQSRRIAGRIDVTLAGGQSYTHWRSGYTNVDAGGSFVTSWNQTIPAFASLIGQNRFELAAQDVTPSPFNQPPYAASGDTDTDVCLVAGLAP